MKETTDRPHFRFGDLQIWEIAKELAIACHETADALDRQRLFRYAEQLRGAGLSPSNNIAEGSASTHTNEFRQFLNIARRSVHENASMTLIFEAMNLFPAGNAQTDLILEKRDDSTPLGKVYLALHDACQIGDEFDASVCDMNDPDQAAVAKTYRILTNKVIYAHNYLKL